MPKGFSAQVYRHGPDCTNKGPSFHRSHVVIVDPKVPAMTEVDPSYSFAVVIKHKSDGYIYAEPLVDGAQTPWFMMGGNFIYSSDSRFRAAFGDRPIPLHDRQE